MCQSREQINNIQWKRYWRRKFWKIVRDFTLSWRSLSDIVCLLSVAQPLSETTNNTV